MTFTLSFRRAALAFTGISAFARFAGREVYVSRPDGQGVKLTSFERSPSGVEVWGLGFYVCVCRCV